MSAALLTAALSSFGLHAHARSWDCSGRGAVDPERGTLPVDAAGAARGSNHPLAKGIVLSFRRRWPNEGETESILARAKQAGLTDKGRIERFKAWILEWPEWRDGAEAEEACRDISALLQGAAGERSVLDYCEPDYLIEPDEEARRIEDDVGGVLVQGVLESRDGRRAVMDRGASVRHLRTGKRPASTAGHRRGTVESDRRAGGGPPTTFAPVREGTRRMAFYADLHVHSKYSRATSRNCDLEHLSIWARKKGIAIVGTGDFTHPAWRAEIRERLVPAEPGLYRLRPDLERAVEEQLPPACRSERTTTRFMLSVEISTIYKKFDKTRKIHHLVYAPDFDAMDRVTASLARIGNLNSDGRPILGLDSRHLLEITLESDPGSYLVPAHIWTPWFAALGSKSGFDAIDECYGDLAKHIFAVETGLSSDPPMNWRVSSLDRFRLVSNSDAHSPEKLGREVCVFDTDLDYFALRRALETGEGYGGTLEFFPEEGKYHLDGHRSCEVRLSPNETRQNEGRCPVCGKPLTVGVMHRVEDLADRPEEVAPPATAGAMRSLVPLPEILSEIHQVGPKSRRVARDYESLLGRLGPELPLLNTVPLEDIRPASSSLVAEAVSRLRREEVVREAGYDGVYGTIRLFEDAELRRYTRGASLFGEAPAAPPPSPPVERDGPSLQRAASPGVPENEAGAEPRSAEASSSPATASLSEAASTRLGSSADPTRRLPATDVSPSPRAHEFAVVARTDETVGREPAAPDGRSADILAGLDADQRRAAETTAGPLLIVAGPGSGKTRTLTHRIAHLIASHGASPAECLAITFTRRAAGEMRERLRALLPVAWECIALHTFHSFGLSGLREHWNAAGLQRGFRVAPEAERIELLRDALGVSERKACGHLAAISRARRTAAPSPPAGDEPNEAREAGEVYRRRMELRNWVDFDDLVIRAADVLEFDPSIRAEYRQRHPFVSIDEYQDVDAQQVRLVRMLVAPDGNVCAIGDPDQAIYRFRGADVRLFSGFRQHFPGAGVVRLTRNYRSDRNIIALSSQVIARSGSDQRSVPVIEDAPDLVTLHEAPTEKAEAEFIVQSLEQALGGHSFFSIDSGRSTESEGHDLSFSDFAVLYRTEAQAAPLVEALARSGMPFLQRSHHRLLDHPGVAALVDALREAPGAGSVLERLQAVRPDGGDGDATETRAARELLRPVAQACGEDTNRFFAELALGTEVDAWDPRADRISLLTLHAAKGLEYPVVFISGCEDGLLPLKWGKAEPEDLEEERRLFYVGVTRAKSKLFLTRAGKRLARGKVRERAPSPYLADIEERLLERHRPRLPEREAKGPDPQLDLFAS